MPQISPAYRGRMILVGLTGALVGFWVFSARSALFPFLIGAFLVYLLLPLVNFFDDLMPTWFKKSRVARPLAILLTYLLVLTILVGFFAIFVPLVTDQISQLIEVSGQYTIQLFRFTKGLNKTLVDEWILQYRDLLPEWVRQTLDSNIQQVTAFVNNALQNVISWLVNALRSALLGTIGVVGSTVSFVLGIIIVPFWMFYVLNDQQRIMETLGSIIPERYRPDVHNLQLILGRVLASYLRGQLVLCLFVGLMATMGLMILGVKLSVLLGTIAAVFEVVPAIGPILGGIPAVLIALLTSPALALKTLILYVAIQQVENLLLVPKVTGHSVKLHPTVTMLVLLIGSEVAGIWGVLLAVPLTAIARDLFWYLYLRTGPEAISPEQAIARLLPPQPVPAADLPLVPWPERLALRLLEVHWKPEETRAYLLQQAQGVASKVKTSWKRVSKPNESR